MEEIARLKLFIQDFENSNNNNTPLTKPKPKPIDKKPIEVNQDELLKELPTDTKINQEEIKTIKKKRINTPGQIEALKKAQEVRKNNIDKKKKFKEYESALKLLEYYETEPKAVKKKIIKQVEKEYESEEDVEPEEEEEEEDEPIKKQRPMKSMKNKKYSETPKQQTYKPKINFFTD